MLVSCCTLQVSACVPVHEKEELQLKSYLILVF
jgi:hypothetical protein